MCIALYKNGLAANLIYKCGKMELTMYMEEEEVIAARSFKLLRSRRGSKRDVDVGPALWEGRDREPQPSLPEKDS